jgi:genome maintenance exonuclease 1
MRFLKLPKFELIAQTDPLSGERVYHTPDGACSSVTTILNNTADKTWLDGWRQRVGEERADRIRNNASNRGTALHTAVERYFQSGQKPDLTDFGEKLILGPYWNALAPILPTVRNHVVAESCIWHPEGFAGRFDDLMHVSREWFPRLLDEDLPSLIDYKTSDKMLTPKKVYEYSLQLAAYIAGINYCYSNLGVELNHAAIVALVSGHDKPYIYEFVGDELDQLFDHFLARKNHYAFAKC